MLCLCMGGIIGSVIGVMVYRKTKQEQEWAKKEKCHVPYGAYEALFKRPLDIVLSVMGLLILSPVMLITAFLIRIKLGSPVIFTQERPGKIDLRTGKEKIFKLYKFRTMTDARDGNGKLLPDEVRLTKFGKKLRSTSLDELPELFNILRGDMSLVGPRPLLVEYLPFYNKKEKHRHDVRPGLTGLSQVNGRNFLGWNKRFELDVKYTKEISFINDLKIIVKTVNKIMKRSDIAENTITVEPNFANERREGKV